MQVDTRLLAELLLNESDDRLLVISPETEVVDALRRVEREGTATLESVRRTKDGSLLQVAVLMRLLEHPLAGRFFAATLQAPASPEPRESPPDIAHELRTPLTAIIGFAGLMARAKEMSPEHREYVDEILASSKRMLALINDTFASSERESNE